MVEFMGFNNVQEYVCMYTLENGTRKETKVPGSKIKEKHFKYNFLELIN